MCYDGCGPSSASILVTVALVNPPMRTFKTIIKVIYALSFMGTGISHFWNPPFYLRIMPDYIPVELHAPAVYVSGVLEIVLGVMLTIPATTRLAGWGLILLLIAVFPANIHAFQHSRELFPDLSPALHFWRLPLQNVMIVMAYWFTRANRPRTESRSENVAG
jgi:uncharacterized membrane protein